MTASAMFLEVVAFLATSAGAGAAAYVLLDLARKHITTGPAGDLLQRRAVMRVLSILLPIVLVGLFSVVLAVLQQQPIAATLDTALGAAIAAQLVHLKDLVGQYATTSAVEFTLDDAIDGADKVDELDDQDAIVVRPRDLYRTPDDLAWLDQEQRARLDVDAWREGDR